MAEHQLVLLRVTVLSPELPLPTHLDRPIAVCFCGRSLHARPRVCGVCGWSALGDRRAAGRLVESDPAAELGRALA